MLEEAVSVVAAVVLEAARKASRGGGNPRVSVSTEIDEVVPDGVDVLAEVEVDCRGRGARERPRWKAQAGGPEVIDSELNARAGVEPKALSLAIMACTSAMPTELVVSSASETRRWLLGGRGAGRASCRLSCRRLAG
jgi:hypothetical protein